MKNITKWNFILIVLNIVINIILLICNFNYQILITIMAWTCALIAYLEIARYQSWEKVVVNDLKELLENIENKKE